MKLKCKICKNDSVVWCGSEEHHKQDGDEIHDCHQLVCLSCGSIYDLGYCKKVKEREDIEDESYLESLEKMRTDILDLYENGL